MPLRGYHLLKAALREARPAIATRSQPDRLHLDDARTVIAAGTVVAPGAVVAVPLPPVPAPSLDGSYLRLVDADGWRVDARTIGRDAVVRAGWWLPL